MENFKTDVNLEVPAHQLYDAIARDNGPGRWWTEYAEVGEKVGDEAKFRFYGGGFAHFRITEMVENKRVVWHCEDHDRSEWLDTRVQFEIEPVSEDSCILHFEHVGLEPQLTCFKECKMAWTFILRQSLRRYLLTGTGELEAMRQRAASSD